MVVVGAQDKIVGNVSRWEGVEAQPHRFGGTEFRLGRRELGHIHGDYQADIVFPMKVRNRLIEERRVEPHHVLPESGWITFRFRKEADVDAAVELFKLSYDLARETDGQGSLHLAFRSAKARKTMVNAGSAPQLIKDCP